MDKLILIDGNSLLNRAYYAMGVFSTKDGLPTNGIFGFIKLIFKIIEDEKPTHFAVAFDVHAPTFRHKMYDGYKATRKPMPEDLAKQVPVLKDLLVTMKIKTVELAGYEADDVIGTLSRKFQNTEIVIYTGDRDSYQLVNENVSVCFTKRGVSDIDRLNAENFRTKIGLEPWQIVEEKSLKGDSSDNIPGVHGIGGKTALELLQTYGSLKNVYQNLANLSPSVQHKLIIGESMAKLSHKLATIDTDVPLEIRLEDCKLDLPFPEEARSYFSRLEFRSLLSGSFFPAERKINAEIVHCNGVETLRQLLPKIQEFALSLGNRSCHIYTGGTEYVIRIKENILDEGVFLNDLTTFLQELLSGDRRVLVSDVKKILPRLEEIGVRLNCTAEDVTLMRYIANSNSRPMGDKEFVQDYALPEEFSAYSLKLAYDESLAACSEEEKKLYREVEYPLAYVLLDMERAGVRVDLEKFPEFSEKYNAELSELSKRIFELAGVKSFNLNSPFQLSEILFEKLGFDSHGLKKNIRGGYSTSADVLEKLAEEHEIARLVLRYREIQKLLSTYIDGIRPLIRNGLIHTTYNQTMTTTGRLSSANPNLQNIPIRKDEGRELRKLFIAREGNVFIDADYSQIELRLLAHFSDCKVLKEAYRNGEDVHAATAAKVFGVPLTQVTSKMRSRAKTINFGIIYGMGRFGLSKDLGCSIQEAESFIDKYFESHPEVREYMNENVRLAKENGFVTTILGRKRYIPEIKSNNFTIRTFGERAAMNMPLQGSAADIIKLAMLRVVKRLEKEKMQSKMVLQVHDELILDAPEAESERARKLLKEEMERAIELSVPLIAEVSAGRSWYDAK